ncbi:MAG: DUF6151 family protein [Steroidobacteraceae bacterium]
MNHPLQCTCGTLKGYVSHPERVNRVVCYCKDCQAFAHFLGRADEILDVKGGTDVIQTVPANVTFTEGQQALACMRLSPQGLLRWYAQCCNTPIGNNLADFRISFIGLVHTCLENPNGSLDESFGPVRMWSFTKSASEPTKSHPAAMFTGILRFIGMLIRARISGDYKRTPLFLPHTGAPVVAPKVLSQSERAALMNIL